MIVYFLSGLSASVNVPNNNSFPLSPLTTEFVRSYKIQYVASCTTFIARTISLLPTSFSFCRQSEKWLFGTNSLMFLFPYVSFATYTTVLLTSGQSSKWCQTKFQFIYTNKYLYTFMHGHIHSNTFAYPHIYAFKYTFNYFTKTSSLKALTFIYT